MTLSRLLVLCYCLCLLLLSCPCHAWFGSRTSSKGVYICITGQMNRLELRNKINKLLRPLQSIGYDIYIALALHVNSSHFTNDNFGDKMRLVPNVYRAEKLLRRLKGVKEVMHFPPRHEEKLFVNKKYQKMLDNDKSAFRVKNHARQYQTLQFCNQWPSIEKLTQMVIRVREDILFEMIDVGEIAKVVELQGGIVTSTCDAWAGVNDKVAFLPSSYAHDFFHLPYEKYLSFDADIPQLNPEQFYKHVYQERGFPLRNISTMYVAKAITRRIPLMTGVGSDVEISKKKKESNKNSKFCDVFANVHKSFSPGCDHSLFRNPDGTANSKLVKVAYKSRCW